MLRNGTQGRRGERPSLVEGLRERLLLIGLDASALEDAGQSVWLFGSHAAGCSAPTSDWDILVFGGAPGSTRRQIGEFDVVTHSGALHTWLTTDLASHVSEFGLRISGGDLPAAAPRLAAPRKQQLVRQRAELLLRLWPLFPTAKRIREVVRLRRDVQRRWLLTCNEAVPPRPLLDEAWAHLSRADRWSLVAAAEVSGPVAKLMTSH